MYNTVTRLTTQPPYRTQQRDAATHSGNSHSAPAGRMVYNIYGWWCSDAMIASEILVPSSNPKNRIFVLTDDGQKLVDK